MSWLRCDDMLPDHVKADRLEEHCAGDAHLLAAAWMVWLHMGCDCSRRSTDGRFTLTRARRVVRQSAEMVDRAVAALVAAGLLDREGGEVAFHDWSDYQPTRAQKDAQRKAKTERQRRWRDGVDGAVDARVDASTPPPTDASTQASRDASTDDAVDVPRDASRSPSRGGDEGRVRVDAAPSRPVPSRPVPKTEDRQVDEPAPAPDASGAGAPLPLIPSEAPKADPIAEVFAHWQRATGKERAKLDPKRRTLIARALKGRTVAELCRCVDGYAADPWHRGENDRGRGYLDLSLMLRDAEHIEKGQELPVGTAPPRPPGAPPVPAPASGRPPPHPADHDRPRGPVVPLSELAKYRDALKIARGEVLS